MTKKIILLIKEKIKIMSLFPYGVILYIRDFIIYFLTNKNEEFRINGVLPIITDRWKNAGTFDRHYFLMDIHMAKVVCARQPKKHFDIGSRLDGFISHLLVQNINVTMIDIRPLPMKIDNIDFIQADATNLDRIEDKSIGSLSSLHAIEHFGLGRYSDNVEPDACFKAMKAMQRVIAEDGFLYLAVPIGSENRCIFNSHREFMPKTILEQMDELTLIEFSWINSYQIYSLYGKEAYKKIIDDEIKLQNYDCGMFVFKRERGEKDGVS